jgi:hypothetical protein
MWPVQLPIQMALFETQMGKEAVFGGLSRPNCH